MWEEIYEAHYPELLRYSIGACRDRAAAEDLCQEVFLRALQNADTFEDLGPSQRRAWLYRTLKNLITDRYRRATLEAGMFMDAEAATATEPGFARAETALLLQRLPPEDMALFSLRYLEGYTAAELAGLFSIPAGTVRCRLHRSRKLLQQWLTEK